MRLVRPMTTRELLHQSAILAGFRISLAERARNMQGFMSPELQGTFSIVP